MATAHHTGEPIRPGELYTLDETMNRLGWGRHAMRQARKSGLKVIRQGGRAYLMSDDILEYFKTLKS